MFHHFFPLLSFLLYHFSRALHRYIFRCLCLCSKQHAVLNITSFFLAHSTISHKLDLIFPIFAFPKSERIDSEREKTHRSQRWSFRSTRTINASTAMNNTTLTQRAAHRTPVELSKFNWQPPNTVQPLLLDDTKATEQNIFCCLRYYMLVKSYGKSFPLWKSHFFFPRYFLFWSFYFFYFSTLLPETLFTIFNSIRELSTNKFDDIHFGGHR